MTDIEVLAKRINLTCESKLIDRNPHMDDWKDATHWKVTLSRGVPRTADNPQAECSELTTYYSMGSAHTGEPEAVEVLDCLVSDAQGVSNGTTFEEWAGDYGYDEDSRKALKTFEVIHEQAKELREFLGDDYEAFLECEGL